MSGSHFTYRRLGHKYLMASVVYAGQHYINSFPGQNGRHFANDIFRGIFLNEKCGIRCRYVKLTTFYNPRSSTPYKTWPGRVQTQGIFINNIVNNQTENVVTTFMEYDSKKHLVWQAIAESNHLRLKLQRWSPWQQTSGQVVENKILTWACFHGMYLTETGTWH